MNLLLSICIPSYNRTDELVRLLNSIDCQRDAVEIVICEDKSPRRAEIAHAVHEFKSKSQYKINYYENNVNLGYDGNIRHLIEVAIGEFVLFMGDDDFFIAGALDRFISFLKENSDAGYILRAYYMEHEDGTLEIFRYHNGVKRFEPNPSVAAWLFKRTVSIGGVTFKRESALKAATNKFDGTLLYQLHLVLEIATREISVYSDIPVAIMAQTYRKDKPMFGSAQNEQRFVTGKVTALNSIIFTRGFFDIAEAFDKKYQENVSNFIRNDLSKYSYPFLSIQRKNGFFAFIRYAVRLAKETKINQTYHFYLYTCALLFLGEYLCDRLIIFIKKRIGYTPNL